MFGHGLNQFDSDWHQPGQLLAGAGLNTSKIFVVEINFSFRNSGKICCKFKKYNAVILIQLLCQFVFFILFKSGFCKLKF